jgi:hypothetical protein
VAEGEGELTERAQRQRTRALTGGPGRQGTRARSVIHGPSRAIRIRRRGSEAGQGRACAKRYPRSKPFDLNHTEGTRPGMGERLRAAMLLSAAVRSP